MFARKFQCIGLVLIIELAFSPVSTTYAYTPENHEKSILIAANLCKANYGIALSGSVIENMIYGVEEPDSFSVSSIQMLKQRVEPGSYGKRRNIVTIRIAAQSIHGSPNPTRPIYTNSKADKAALKKTTRVPNNRLMKDRLPVDIYSYDTNQGVRNKLLINASQFLCVSIAHRSDEQSARKFGNFMHMIGDTYSASHVQRSAPTGSLKKCGTEKIEWHYSMDLISWKQHRPADLQTKDWRFRCLTQHTASLMKIWFQSREGVKGVKGENSKREIANREVRKTLKLLCNRVLKEDASTLNQPAGGANVGYSSASGTDNWRGLKKKLPDRAIQPVGLTSAEEARAFYRNVDRDLKKDGYDAGFSYPSRDVPDLCRNILSSNELHPTLQCTKGEILWAMNGSGKVKTLWIPARALP
jgi:hypothetical protein